MGEERGGGREERGGGKREEGGKGDEKGKRKRGTVYLWIGIREGGRFY